MASRSNGGEYFVTLGTKTFDNTIQLETSTNPHSNVFIPGLASTTPGGLYNLIYDSTTGQIYTSTTAN